MASNATDLWPDDIAVDVLSPQMILNEQAEALSRRTKGIVRGELVAQSMGEFEEISLDLLAPAVGFRHRLLKLRYAKIRPYPAIVISGTINEDTGFGDPPGSKWSISSGEEIQLSLSSTEQVHARLVHTPDSVQRLLKYIFNADSTKSLLYSMIARSNEITRAALNSNGPPAQSGDSATP